MVTGGGLQIPELVVVHDGDAEALPRPYGFDDIAKQGNGLAGRTGAGEQHIGNIIFRDTLILDIGIEGECRGRGENGLGAADSDPFLVETGGAVQLGLPVRHSGVTQGVFGQRVAEIIGALMGF